MSKAPPTNDPQVNVVNNTSQQPSQTKQQQQQLPNGRYVTKNFGNHVINNPHPLALLLKRDHSIQMATPAVHSSSGGRIPYHPHHHSNHNNQPRHHNNHHHNNHHHGNKYTNSSMKTNSVPDDIHYHGPSAALSLDAGTPMINPDIHGDLIGTPSTLHNHNPLGQYESPTPLDFPLPQALSLGDRLSDIHPNHSASSLHFDGSSSAVESSHYLTHNENNTTTPLSISTNGFNHRNSNLLNKGGFDVHNHHQHHAAAEASLWKKRYLDLLQFVLITQQQQQQQQQQQSVSIPSLNTPTALSSTTTGTFTTPHQQQPDVSVNVTTPTAGAGGFNNNNSARENSVTGQGKPTQPITPSSSSLNPHLPPDLTTILNQLGNEFNKHQLVTPRPTTSSVIGTPQSTTQLQTPTFSSSAAIDLNITLASTLSPESTTSQFTQPTSTIAPLPALDESGSYHHNDNKNILSTTASLHSLLHPNPNNIQLNPYNPPESIISSLDLAIQSYLINTTTSKHNPLNRFSTPQQHHSFNPSSPRGPQRLAPIRTPTSGSISRLTQHTLQVQVHSDDDEEENGLMTRDSTTSPSLETKFQSALTPTPYRSNHANSKFASIPGPSAHTPPASAAGTKLARNSPGNSNNTANNNNSPSSPSLQKESSVPSPVIVNIPNPSTPISPLIPAPSSNMAPISPANKNNNQKLTQLSEEDDHDDNFNYGGVSRAQSLQSGSLLLPSQQQQLNNSMVKSTYPPLPPSSSQTAMSGNNNNQSLLSSQFQPNQSQFQPNQLQFQPNQSRSMENNPMSPLSYNNYNNLSTAGFTPNSGFNSQLRYSTNSFESDNDAARQSTIGELPSFGLATQSSSLTSFGSTAGLFSSQSFLANANNGGMNHISQQQQHHLQQQQQQPTLPQFSKPTLPSDYFLSVNAQFLPPPPLSYLLPIHSDSPVSRHMIHRTASLLLSQRKNIISVFASLKSVLPWLNSIATTFNSVSQNLQDDQCSDMISAYLTNPKAIYIFNLMNQHQVINQQSELFIQQHRTAQQNFLDGSSSINPLGATFNSFGSLGGGFGFNTVSSLGGNINIAAATTGSNTGTNNNINNPTNPSLSTLHSFSNDSFGSLPTPTSSTTRHFGSNVNTNNHSTPTKPRVGGGGGDQPKSPKQSAIPLSTTNPASDPMSTANGDINTTHDLFILGNSFTTDTAFQSFSTILSHVSEFFKQFSEGVDSSLVLGIEQELTTECSTLQSLYVNYLEALGKYEELFENIQERQEKWIKNNQQLYQQLQAQQHARHINTELRKSQSSTSGGNGGNGNGGLAPVGYTRYSTLGALPDMSSKHSNAGLSIPQQQQRRMSQTSKGDNVKDNSVGDKKDKEKSARGSIFSRLSKKDKEKDEKDDYLATEDVSYTVNDSFEPEVLQYLVSHYHQHQANEYTKYYGSVNHNANKDKDSKEFNSDDPTHERSISGREPSVNSVVSHTGDSKTSASNNSSLPPPIPSSLQQPTASSSSTTTNNNHSTTTTSSPLPSSSHISPPPPPPPSHAPPQSQNSDVMEIVGFGSGGVVTVSMRQRPTPFNTANSIQQAANTSNKLPTFVPPSPRSKAQSGGDNLRLSTPLASSNLNSTSANTNNTVSPSAPNSSSTTTGHRGSLQRNSRFMFDANDQFETQSIISVGSTGGATYALSSHNGSTSAPSPRRSVGQGGGGSVGPGSVNGGLYPSSSNVGHDGIQLGKNNNTCTQSDCLNHASFLNFKTSKCPATFQLLLHYQHPCIVFDKNQGNGVISSRYTNIDTNEPFPSLVKTLSNHSAANNNNDQFSWISSPQPSNHYQQQQQQQQQVYDQHQSDELYALDICLFPPPPPNNSHFSPLQSLHLAYQHYLHVRTLLILYINYLLVSSRIQTISTLNSFLFNFVSNMTNLETSLIPQVNFLYEYQFRLQEIYNSYQNYQESLWLYHTNLIENNQHRPFSHDGLTVSPTHPSLSAIPGLSNGGQAFDQEYLRYLIDEVVPIRTTIPTLLEAEKVEIKQESEQSNVMSGSNSLGQDGSFEGSLSFGGTGGIFDFSGVERQQQQGIERVVSSLSMGFGGSPSSNVLQHQKLIQSQIDLKLSQANINLNELNRSGLLHMLANPPPYLASNLFNLPMENQPSPNLLFTTPKIILCGYMLKQASNITKDWQRRYFVLTTNSLLYFRDCNCYKAQLNPKFGPYLVEGYRQDVSQLKNIITKVKTNGKKHSVTSADDAGIITAKNNNANYNDMEASMHKRNDDDESNRGICQCNVGVKVVDVLLSSARLPSTKLIKSKHVDSSFELVSPQRRCYVLRCATAGERDLWLQTIQKAIGDSLMANTTNNSKKNDQPRESSLPRTSARTRGTSNAKPNGSGIDTSGIGNGLILTPSQPRPPSGSRPQSGGHGQPFSPSVSMSLQIPSNSIQTQSPSFMQPQPSDGSISISNNSIIINNQNTSTGDVLVNATNFPLTAPSPAVLPPSYDPTVRPPHRFPYICTMTYGPAQFQQHNSSRVLSLLSQHNPTCVDCDSPLPDWCSINNGVIICIRCSAIHRSLGVQVSKVRSITLDQLDITTESLLLHIGNRLFNSIYEGNTALVSDLGPKPVLDTTNHNDREQYIRFKYTNRTFVSKQVLGNYAGMPLDMATSAFWAITHNSLQSLIKLNAAGGCDLQLLFPSPTNVCIAQDDEIEHIDISIDVNVVLHQSTHRSIKTAVANSSSPQQEMEEMTIVEIDPSSILIPKDSLTTLLHYAVLHGNVLILEYFVLNTSNLTIKDGLGRTPLDLAKLVKYEHGIARLSKR